MTFFFFLESVQNLIYISKRQKKIKKKFLVSEITTCEMAAVNCLYYEGNTCHGHSMCEETVLRLCISVGEIFSNAIAFTVINNC